MHGTPAEPTHTDARALPAEDALAEALHAEQAHLTRLYARLDTVREQARRTRDRAHAGAGAGGTHQARLERQVRAREAARRAARLEAVERGLCFGRLDERDGTVHYIGRTGLTDDAYDPLLLDWRAPAVLADVDPDHADALLRPPGSPWTVDDVPLLDEAAELLGEPRPTAGTKNEVDELAYADGVLTITGQTDDVLLDAALLAGRFHDDGPYRSTAERAAADRTWAYGHVVVDEAQELSAMAWRAVLRRVPTASLTVVGDLDQTGSPAGARSWAEMLDPHLPGRWREQRLTVNYRTPAPIMAVAAAVLRSTDPDRQPPESVRPGTERPRAVHVPDADWAATLARLPATTGTVGVIAPDALAGELDALTVASSKGLEFDSVVVVEPAAILGQSARDLYVALTRTTRGLTLLHHAPLPEAIASLL